ncbi:hypothetical protein NA56DRAFT_731526 [Hyaloscypha hepaticicola]|uniref:Uncharacterized protein n=1 Tax=Hyaloscypha hepaticicola TaxID=2082293 RepID=A0A2J6PQG3_9HELO|nr:hypothetical protein NA56DRAFT_731526 [Hyaloscypha hepaticicola]
MPVKQETPTSYQLGSLPTKIKKFIEVSSDANAYRNRTHSHHSLLNAYMVATFLEEASQYVPPMKRDAGLRDLAQRLHLWPGDMAMQLQRDSLQAIELLEKYIQQTLTEELRFVERSSPQATENNLSGQKTVEHMSEMKQQALQDLRRLKHELKEQVSKHHLDFSSTDLELHDLSPFIPGFASARAKAPNMVAQNPSASSSKAGSMATSIADLASSYNMLSLSGINPERTEALAACEKFKDTAKWVVDEFMDVIENGSMKLLERKVENMADIQEVFERMGLTLFRLLNAGGQRDYDSDVGSVESSKTMDPKNKREEAR